MTGLLPAAGWALTLLLGVTCCALVALYAAAPAQSPAVTAQSPKPRRHRA